jgi:hypothetical protein
MLFNFSSFDLVSLDLKRLYCSEFSSWFRSVSRVVAGQILLVRFYFAARSSLAGLFLRGFSLRCDFPVHFTAAGFGFARESTVHLVSVSRGKGFLLAPWFSFSLAVPALSVLPVPISSAQERACKLGLRALSRAANLPAGPCCRIWASAGLISFSSFRPELVFSFHFWSMSPRSILVPRFVFLPPSQAPILLL